MHEMEVVAGFSCPDFVWLDKWVGNAHRAGVEVGSDVFLEIGLGLLAVERNLFEHKDERVHVDGHDPLKGDPGVSEGLKQEVSGGERNPLAFHPTAEEYPFFVRLIDGYLKPVIRKSHAEVQLCSGGGERGDVEFLDLLVPESAVREGIRPEDVEFLLVKGIGHFCEDAGGMSVRIVDEVEGDRVEDVSEGPQVGDQADRADGSGVSLAAQVADEVFPDGGCAGLQVIGGPQGIDGSRPVSDQRIAIEQMNFIQIDAEHEDPIVEGMHLRSPSVMVDFAVIQAGFHDRDRGGF